MKLLISKEISIYSLLLFFIPIITLLICIQIHILHYNLHSFPFIDGGVSVSFIGRQEKTINFFKLGFLINIIVSLFFYYRISNFFSLKKIKTNFKILGILSNIFLFIYIYSLGNEGAIYEISKRLAIILYIVLMFINHAYMIKMIKLLRLQEEIKFNKIYIKFFYLILSFMTILIIIGTPWINPLFKYPDKLKNIIEWNYFLLTIIFYLPISMLFFKLIEKK
jgi:hypothetical protein